MSTFLSSSWITKSTSKSHSMGWTAFHLCRASFVLVVAFFLQFFFITRTRIIMSDKEAKAKTLFEEGKLSFNKGDYSASITKLGEACQLL